MKIQLYFIYSNIPLIPWEFYPPDMYLYNIDALQNTPKRIQLNILETLINFMKR